MADDRHHFTITATVRSDGADHVGQLGPVEVRAWSLNEALEAAAALPFPAWFPDEDANRGAAGT